MADDEWTWRGYGHIAPDGEGFYKETFETWFARVATEIPHVPACVAEQWLHRHWGHSPYEWLPLVQLHFVKQLWTNERILAIGQSIEPETTRYWGDELGVEDNFRRTTWLGKYMLERRSWPAPIIVFDNPDALVSPMGEQLARWHLLEGHMRSAYHQHLVTAGTALPQHEVWVTTIET